MGRLLEPVSNGRARSMIEFDRTRLIALLLEYNPSPCKNRKGLFFCPRNFFNTWKTIELFIHVFVKWWLLVFFDDLKTVCFSIQFYNLANQHNYPIFTIKHG
jgi:hypothetical protein